MTRPASSSPFHELERLVRHLGDELAGFRRRALQAEARVRELEEALAQRGEDKSRGRGARGDRAVARAAADGDDIASADDRAPVALDADASTLAAENAVLRDRLHAASVRTRRMLDRMRFLRQQQQAQPENAR